MTFALPLLKWHLREWFVLTFALCVLLTDSEFQPIVRRSLEFVIGLLP